MGQGPEADNTDTLPLDAWHRARGGRMVPFAGYAMPVQYEGIVAEHEWTRHHAGLFDVSHMGQLVFSAETLAVPVDGALEALIPAELRFLDVCRQRYSLLLSSDGGIRDDLMLARLPFPSPFAALTGSDRRGTDRFYMVVNGATKRDDILYLRAHLPDDVLLHHLEEWALVALQGPQAAAALARLVPGVEELSFMMARSMDWRGTALYISRSGYTGEDGFEISVPADKVVALADELAAQPEVRPAGLGARDSLRLEAGLPLYGHDLDTSTDPISAGLAWAIAKRRREEGGFPGHARLVDILASGPEQRRVGLSIEGRLPAREGAEVFAGDTLVGRVTSGGFSPTLGHPIAMAYVSAAQAAPGTSLSIEVRGRRLDAKVVPLPFVPHRYHRQGAAR